MVDPSSQVLLVGRVAWHARHRLANQFIADTYFPMGWELLHLKVPSSLVQLWTTPPFHRITLTSAEIVSLHPAGNIRNASARGVFSLPLLHSSYALGKISQCFVRHNQPRKLDDATTVHSFSTFSCNSPDAAVGHYMTSPPSSTLLRFLRVFCTLFERFACRRLA
eukprot:6200739-Pleurochrysis_carterae.AAC.1